MDEETETKLGIKWAEYLELTRVESRSEIQGKKVYMNRVLVWVSSNVIHHCGSAVSSSQPQSRGHHRWGLLRPLCDCWPLASTCQWQKKYLTGRLKRGKVLGSFTFLASTSEHELKVKLFFLSFFSPCGWDLFAVQLLDSLSGQLGAPLIIVSMSLYSSLEDPRIGNVALLGEWCKLLVSC